MLRLKLSQALQISALQGLAAKMLQAQAAGDGAQVGPGFAQQRRHLATKEFYEGVLCEVQRLFAIAQFAPEHGHYPAVMLEIQRADIVGAGWGHGRDLLAAKEIRAW
ncbi:hypothetical protein D3C79_982830 [compost metagenome]